MRSRRPREGQARPLRAAADVDGRPASRSSSRSARSCCASTRRDVVPVHSALKALPEYAGHRRPTRSSSRSAIRAGDQLSIVAAASIGTGLMIIAAIYPIFRRIKLFRWLASNTMWFDFHLMAGTVGPMFIALHSVLKLDSGCPRAFWSMVISVVSGFLGRYLYTQVPELSSGVELEELDHERAFQNGAAAAPRADGRDRSRARRAAREGPAGRDVAERAARAVVAALPGHRPVPAHAGAARPARAARRRSQDPQGSRAAGGSR